MLSELSIDNFAIIDRLLVRFDPGLTVITGETGAGKSIIIDALQAALGARTSSDVVRSGARFAAVEAVFDPMDRVDVDTLNRLLEEAGIDGDDSLILRREISAAGRGTARINGRAVPLSLLAAVGSLLVDIHGQSDHLSVLRRDRQLDVLDRFADLLGIREEVETALRAYTALRGDLAKLEGGQRDAEQRLDLLRFQVGEIEAANLRPGEEEGLTAERHLLVNAERLAALSAQVRAQLHGESASASAALSEAVRALSELATIDPSTASLAERLQSAEVEVDDIAQDLRVYGDAVEYDPSRLASIEERIDVLHRLKRKYGSTLQDVIDFGHLARTEMESIEQFDERVETLRSEIEMAESRAGCLAEDLSARRKRAADVLSSRMADALQGLGLTGTDFGVELTRSEVDDGLLLPSSGTRFAYNSTGVDVATFLVSFNPGESLRPLDRVASGGETSRFLLALKSVLAGADATPTLVFDEVDVGVGARHGRAVGERLRELARSHQVLSITHLPQVAALGAHHLTVRKVVAGDRTTTEIEELDSEARVIEIAEMMSGTGTETARRNAFELLEAAQTGT